MGVSVAQLPDDVARGVQFCLQFGADGGHSGFVGLMDSPRAARRLLVSRQRHCTEISKFPKGMIYYFFISKKHI
jgi:hypothetical protein